jgi:type IV secretion system protein VirB9
MKLALKLAILAFFTPMVVSAAPNNDILADKYFSKNEPSLTPQEKAAIDIANKFQKGNYSSKPFAGPHGSINYVYTIGQIDVLCAVLQVCDVALQPGEQVNNLNIGDPRFQIEPAITGFGESQTLHLLIKPLDVGLDTTLVVTTNRRTYHFRVRSSRDKFMPYVDFTYPEDAIAKWQAIRDKKVEHIKDNTIPSTNEYLGDLDFQYQIDGSIRWTPTRVYNDGKKTIIEMPYSMQQTEAPTLLVIRKEGGIFTDDDIQMVNYRLQGNRYIVDSVFDKAMLIAGVGSNQDKVTITRGK